MPTVPEFVDLWDDCVCRPASYKVPNEAGGYDYVHACTCPEEETKR